MGNWFHQTYWLCGRHRSYDRCWYCIYSNIFVSFYFNNICWVIKFSVRAKKGYSEELNCILEFGGCQNTQNSINVLIEFLAILIKCILLFIQTWTKTPQPSVNKYLICYIYLVSFDCFSHDHPNFIVWSNKMQLHIPKNL